jgi:hypothetical protein
MIGSIGDVYVFDLAADVADGVAHGEIPKPFGGEQNVGATDEGVSQSLTAAALEAVFSSEIFDLVGGAAPTGNATEVEGDSDVAEALAEVAALEAVQALTHLIKTNILQYILSTINTVSTILPALAPCEAIPHLAGGQQEVSHRENGEC